MKTVIIGQAVASIARDGGQRRLNVTNFNCVYVTCNCSPGKMVLHEKRRNRHRSGVHTLDPIPLFLTRLPGHILLVAYFFFPLFFLTPPPAAGPGVPGKLEPCRTGEAVALACAGDGESVTAEAGAAAGGGRLFIIFWMRVRLSASNRPRKMEE